MHCTIIVPAISAEYHTIDMPLRPGGDGCQWLVGEGGEIWTHNSNMRRECAGYRYIPNSFLWRRKWQYC